MSLLEADLPEPLRQDVHRGGFYKASLGEHVEYTVEEIEHPGMIIMTMECNSVDFRSCGVKFLAGIVALRRQEGWTLMSLSDSAAALTKGE